MNLDQFQNLAFDWTRESGKLILEHFRDPDLKVDQKKDASPVTQADRQAEQVLRERISEHFPTHGIVGEEFDSVREEAEWTWLVDPIDGTKSFVAGVPLFGTVLCLQFNGKPVLGAIHLPALGDQLLVGDGNVALLDGNKVSVRESGPCGEWVILTSDERDIPTHRSEVGWKSLLKNVAYCRTWGDCYGYYLVATGKADVMLDPIVNPWDFHGAIPIIQGAGGKITNWIGEEAAGSDSTVAASSEIHSTVLSFLNH
ncbi:MAG: histidinol-phosphatase [Verrucomicrobia bacterium]|nr:histidinol-phosphatase [Verrucomicrobiota bacterium]MDA0723370.1 histidinol-phosphatase [Verrucomicrobiota bacterium]MDA1045557.1 histidinol-phosphatase [Verrucomicrobiota bacterium]